MIILLALVCLVAYGIHEQSEILWHLRRLEREARFQKWMLFQILDELKPLEALKVSFFVIKEGRKEKVEFMFLQDDKSLPVSVEFADAKGNVAKVDGAPVWAVSDESLASLQVAADGMSAMVIPVGPLGSFKLQVKADADLGAGMKEILGEMSIEVIGGEAVAVNIKAGEPV